jgi:hypothetical protein
VVFCGECGSPVALGGTGRDAPAERAARLPGAPTTTPGPGAADRMKRANTLVGSLPGVPVSPSSAPPLPSDRIDTRRTVMGMPAAFPPKPADGRTPAVTMVSPTAAPETKPGKGGRRRRNSTTEDVIRVPVEARAPAPVEAAAKPATTAASPSPPATADAADAWDMPDPPAPAAPAAAKPQVDDSPQIEVHAEPVSGREAVAPDPPVLAADAAAASAPATVETGKSPAPEAPLRASTVPPHEADETQRLLDDLDAGFESIVRPSAPVVWLGSPASSAGEMGPPDAAPQLGFDDAQPTASTVARAARHEADMAEVRALFAGIAVAYARPLRDFMIEVAWGEPTKEWLEVALPATQALRRAAAAVELPEVDVALEGYMTALELGMGEGSIHREVREMLAGAYARLIDAMPSVFALEGELGRREPIIVRSLLLQVPGVRHVAIDKLYKAGINALDVFYAARPRELAEATGLDEPVAAAICERFQRYKREVAELSPGKDRARERAELGMLAEELSRAHASHEKAAASWAPGAAAERNRARQVRADTLLRIDLLLAHLGEVDLQRTIAKMPFQQKIKELRRFLDEAEQRAVH